MQQSQAETGVPPSWSTEQGATPPPFHPPLKTGLRSSRCTRTRPRFPWWAVMAPAACRTPGYERSCQGSAQPPPCAPNTETGETVDRCHPLPPPCPGQGWHLSPWPPLLARSFVLTSLVFTGPLDAKMAAGGVWVMGGALLGGPIALWRGLRPGPQRPAGLHVASDAPTLCPELRFWVGPLPVPCPEPPAS